MCPADVPLRSTFGLGSSPYEWMDMCYGCVGCSLALPARRALVVRLFDLATGALLREATCTLPDPEELAVSWGAHVQGQATCPSAPLGRGSQCKACTRRRTAAVVVPRRAARYAASGSPARGASRTRGRGFSSASWGGRRIGRMRQTLAARR